MSHLSQPTEVRLAPQEQQQHRGKLATRMNAAPRQYIGIPRTKSARIHRLPRPQRSLRNAAGTRPSHNAAAQYSHMGSTAYTGLAPKIHSLAFSSVSCTFAVQLCGMGQANLDVRTSSGLLL